MSAVAPIVLADAQVSPVNHTFAVQGMDRNGVWLFEDQSAADAIAFNRIGVSLARPPTPGNGTSSRDRVARVKFSVACPVAETLGTSDSGLTPAPTLAYINRFNGEFVLSERSTAQDRKDLRKYVQYLFADAIIIPMIESYSNLY